MPKEEEEELRQLIREAHETLKDLKREIRVARAIKDELHSVIESELAEIMAMAAKEQIAIMTVTVGRQIEAAVGAVNERFDKLAKQLFYEDERQRAKGAMSLETFVQFLRARGESLE